jgi:hypothetical protein
LSTTEWLIIAASIGFSLWLLWMSGRAKNPVRIAVFGIPIFARSMGGSYKVRYKLELNEKGRPKLTLDGSGLPEFRKSKY